MADFAPAHPGDAGETRGGQRLVAGVGFGAWRLRRAAQGFAWRG